MKNLNIYAVSLYTLLFISLMSACTADKSGLSVNKTTVTQYMDGFRVGDHAKILSCLTDDIIWEMPGVYHHTGKIEFDKEIENEAFTGRPKISIIRMVEENDVVIAEGTVEAGKKDGGRLHAVFCDVFLMNKGKIKKLTSYLMVKP